MTHKMHFADLDDCRYTACFRAPPRDAAGNPVTFDLWAGPDLTDYFVEPGSGKETCELCRQLLPHLLEVKELECAQVALTIARALIQGRSRFSPKEVAEHHLAPGYEAVWANVTPGVAGCRVVVRRAGGRLRPGEELIATGAA